MGADYFTDKSLTDLRPMDLPKGAWKALGERKKMTGVRSVSQPLP